MPSSEAGSDRRSYLETLGSIGAFGSAGLLAGFVWLALLPFVTRILTPGDVGVYGAYRATYQLGAQVAPFGAAALIMWTHLGSASHTRRHVASSLVIATGVLLVASGLTIFIGEGLEPVGLPLGAALAAIFTAWLLNWVTMAESVLQMEYRPISFISVRGTEAVMFALLVLGASMFWANWHALVAAQTTAILVAAVVAGVWLHRSGLIAWRPRVKEVGTLLRFGRSYLPHVVGLWIANYIDRYIIAAFVGVDEAGIYVVAYSVSMVFSAIHDGVARNFAPLTAKSVDSKDPGQILRAGAVFYRYLFWAIVLSLISIPPSLWIMGMLVGNEFITSGGLLTPLIIAQAFFGISRYLTGYMVAADMLIARSSITIGMAIINVGLSVWFVGLFGALGAAYATTLTYALGAAAALWMVRRSALLPSLSGLGGFSRLMRSR